MSQCENINTKANTAARHARVRSSTHQHDKANTTTYNTAHQTKAKQPNTTPHNLRQHSENAPNNTKHNTADIHQNTTQRTRKHNTGSTQQAQHMQKRCKNTANATQQHTTAKAQQTHSKHSKHNSAKTTANTSQHSKFGPDIQPSPKWPPKITTQNDHARLQPQPKTRIQPHSTMCDYKVVSYINAFPFPTSSPASRHRTPSTA